MLKIGIYQKWFNILC